MVKNMNDGTVEVVAEGDEKGLEELLARLHKGSLLSRVEKVESAWEEPTGKFSRFEIVYS
jgi:acylphosphatase